MANFTLQETSEKTPPLVTQLSFRNFNFYYGKFQALKNINLDVYKNRVTAFIGPSGCGKSTLLRTLNRMYSLYPEQRAEGELLLDGKNLLDRDLDVNELRARIGMVFQKPTPFPMSIYDNIAFGVRLHERMSRGQMDERVEWALQRAALWDEVKDKLGQSGMSLSGGQQQRLCIARGIAVKPEILLLNEPTSALDPISECLATGVLLATIHLGLRNAAEKVPLLVALIVTAGYWFTASTFFANPAVTIARSFSNTFAGIQPADVAGFIGAQLIACVAACALLRGGKRIS